MNHLLTIGLVLLLTYVGHTQNLPALLQAKPCHERHTHRTGITLELKGVYIDHKLLWLVFHGTNQSAIDFKPVMRIAIRDKHTLKRRALQERVLVPVRKQEPSIVPADSSVQFYYGLVPRIPGRKQELSVQWMERNGDRRLQLHIPAHDILTARRIAPATEDTTQPQQNSNSGDIRGKK